MPKFIAEYSEEYNENVRSYMKIGLSLMDLAMGGAQNFMVQLAQGLAGRGYPINYYLHSSREDPIHTSPTLLKMLDQAASPVNQPSHLATCQVIQLDGYHSLRRKLPYIKIFNRCVETYHSRYSVQRSGPIYTMHRVTISHAIHDYLRLPSHIIYQGVPMPVINWETPRPYDITILGRIHPVKQHLLFLEICERLYQLRGTLQVQIISGYPGPDLYQQKVSAEISRLKNIGVQICITGYLEPAEVYKRLALSKILLVTSKNEGYGRMAAEALACGVPVIANPVGGLKEIIRDGQTGYFSQYNDVQSFTKISNHLLSDPTMRQTLASHGRSEVEQRFSIKTMLDAYENLYRQVAHQ
jgi:glycosyltransferase involved in cell wall biosynthesis